MQPKLGFPGRLATSALNSQLTPLLALFGLLLGIFAALITPREEEPQIDVTMVNVLVPFPGASVADVENLITTPMEQVLSEIDQVEHIYSVSNPGQAAITVQFKVGVPRNEALVRLYNAVYSNQDWRPQNLGVLNPLIKPKGIDDVPVVSLTLWTQDPARGSFELRQIAHSLEVELQRVPGTRDIITIGGPEQVAEVLLDPQRLAARNLSVGELRQALLATNQAADAGARVADNLYVPVQAGQFLTSFQELQELVIGFYDGRPVYLQDVATLGYGPAQNDSYVWYASAGERTVRAPAVTLAISKKPGENAVQIADQLLARVEQLKRTFIPEGVAVSVTRNYGATADAKASKLIQKLIFATLLVVALMLVALGWREALVVGAAVVLTLALTLFASWAWGFTINRVSLFALIFSIGILVDDAIVIVENIHRHRALGRRSFLESIPYAVDEVGGPTVLATFTVIAALLPMAFVSGLMGPYMSPIPINASLGMLLSLVIALTFTPWLASRLLSPHEGVAMLEPRASADHPVAQSATDSRLQRLFERIMLPFLGAGQRKRRYLLGFGLLVLIGLALLLVATNQVVLKMLPFDNKSEFQVVVDLPEGSPVEATNAALAELADALLLVPEVTDLQVYAGTSGPISFNGLVRQYDLRQAPNLGDIQVNLKDKNERDRDSHTIARSARDALAEVGKRHGAAVKVVEVPPGPPVMAPIVAEVYGPDYPGQIAAAKGLHAQFEATAGMVDIDDSIEADSARQIVVINRPRAARLGVTQADIVASLATALRGEDVTYLRTGHAKYPIPVRLNLAVADKARIEELLALKVRSQSGALVPISEVVSVVDARWEHSIYHKDLLPVVYVTADMAGDLDSPLYGMFEVVGKLGQDVRQFFVSAPDNPFNYQIKWDGEWQITYETFRDMGAAYSVGLLLIYLLVVAQFGSYLVPLVIMAPIPLTLIGIMPGHALLGAQFTATSMIGMIALAGIIVRNSILLVDFINTEVASGVSLEDAVVRSAAVRAKPIILTALAAMGGALFILDDPIFNGLAVSLIFGILVSTVLTLVVIPLLYYSVLRSAGAEGDSLIDKRRN